MRENLLELFQAAEQLSISISTVKRYINRGMIEAVNVGAGKYKVYRISQDSLDRFMTARGVNGDVFF